MSETKVTRLMRSFLLNAADVEDGKGYLLFRSERRIASLACSKSYGWMIVSPLPIFFITEIGRAALGVSAP